MTYRLIVLLATLVFSNTLLAVEKPKIDADVMENAAKAAVKPEKVKEDPADIRYKQEMLQLSKAISGKILELQSAEKALNSEIYPAYKAGHKAKIKRIEKQLKDLELKKSQMDANQSARDMAKSLTGS